ncbi:TerB family tellurite resistance protein [Fimbriiglobus ruber]|uniref:Co-chaperone DjlA N-terminal domain-containing protein n=1 Tax=Fimbriiglobus ruber TaxID=1908690 RepID=A0A225D5B9_9BACT|nr:TerB family tellurite resistance protein [Fimbriiglobus ruber]OWK36153.1 hypothetical protein FRUB_08716 [Fimbriiglobus ruber]
MYTALIIFGILAAAFVVFLVVFVRYAMTVAFQWKMDVFQCARGLRNHLQKLEAVDSADGNAAAVKLAAEYFLKELRGISINRLAEYPGIGPATITRLEEFGFRTLADVATSRFDNLPGIGPSRAADLHAAVSALVRDTQARFDAGAVPEALEYRRLVDASRAANQLDVVARVSEQMVVAEAVRGIQEQLDVAYRVTMWRFLLRRPIPGLTAELLNRPLPYVEERHEPAAEAPAAKAQIPLPPVPEAAGSLAARGGGERFVLPPTPPAPVSPPVDIFAADFRTAPVAKVEPPKGDHPWLPKMRAVVGFAFAVSRCDGKVTKSERKIIRGFLEQKFGHDAFLVRNIDPLMEKIESATPPEAKAVDALLLILPAGERPELFALAERIADASGGRTKKEIETLARIAAAFELKSEKASPTPPPPAVAPAPKPNGAKTGGGPDARPPQVKESPPPVPVPDKSAKDSAEDYRALLEIPVGATLDPDLVRRRYANVSEKLDPTKVAALGPEFVRMAEEKRDRVRAAAEALIAPFGVPLDPPAAPPPPADIRHNPALDALFGD